MMESIVARLGEATTLIYALSVLFYFIDFLQHNRKAGKMAFWLLSIVWLLQTVYMFYIMMETDRFPVLNVAEGLYFYTWVLVTLSLVLTKVLRVEFIVFFTNVIGFSMMAIHTFTPSDLHSAELTGKLTSELLVIHITMAILSYGAFSLSFAFSLLYLFQYRLLKKKKWGKWLLRIEDLSKLDHMAYVLNIIGVPMLLLSLILGIIWAYISYDTLYWTDAKVLGSFIMLFLYGFYLYIRLVRNMQGKIVARWNVASFLVLMINYFLLGSLSTFHWFQ
ncbi:MULTISPECIES: cytochrome c biogenesis protein [Bacillus]|jgi:HemX protein|uniref:Negative effector of the concentration of glutamyl-tRNA reductase HemA n=1 Tax=Bacillus altitudinis TaxID=293387 RepID=A0A653U5X9_BACAB|nr:MULTISPECIES: cytochrome c biogenesis protein [Bacillus]AMM89868.1 cytochrome C assembly protein [Bacillus pumilus]EMI12474.1 negative effector of the concentration of glutamyl-trna reductase [Bacillus stratosphericus LAMA 585]KQL40527.1 cytochrome C assembly protein [Bacillus sp. FJAT-21955]MBX7002091.1 cytochrome C assembly protein [Bacillus aerophilus]AMB90594.1 cytochrome C assembly protein [Bacillus altitudinis]